MEKLINKSHEVIGKGLAKSPILGMQFVAEAAMLIEDIYEHLLTFDPIKSKANPRFVDNLHHDIEVHKFDDEFNIMTAPWKEAYDATVADRLEDNLAEAVINLFAFAKEHNIDLRKHIELRLMYESMLL